MRLPPLRGNTSPDASLLSVGFLKGPFCVFSFWWPRAGAGSKHKGSSISIIVENEPDLARIELGKLAARLLWTYDPLAFLVSGFITHCLL